MARMGEDRNAEKDFDWKERRKEIPLGRPGLEWDDNIKMDVREIG